MLTRRRWSRTFPNRAVYIIGAGKIVKHDQAGVLGDQSFNAASVAISETFPNGTSQILQFPNNNQQASDTIPFTMQPGTSLIKVSRGSWSPSNLTISNLYWNGRWINCSPTTTPCYTFDGGHTISVVPIPASYSARSDSQTYALGSSAKISMTTSPLNMIGAHTPIHVDSALWSAAPDSLGGDAADTIPLNACTNYRWDNQYTPVDWLCDHIVKGSGTLTLIGHANGYRMAPQVQIAVRGPTLKLTALPSGDLVTGDTVNFSPSWSDGYQISATGWKWVPDSMPNLISQDGGDCPSTASACTRPIRQNGTMYVTVLRDGKYRTAHVKLTVIIPALQLTAAPSAVNLGESVQFTATAGRASFTIQRWSYNHGPAICGVSQQCNFAPPDSGTMWVYGTVGPHADSASASVAVTDANDGGGPAIARLLVYCYFPGGIPTRGQPVRCETSVQPDSFSFTIINRATSQLRLDSLMRVTPYNKMYSVYTTSDSTPIAIAAHNTDKWEGPAAVQTTVTVRAVIATASGPVSLDPASAKFAPVSRVWGRWHWNESVAEKHYGDIMTVGGYSVYYGGPALFVFPPRNTTSADTTATGVFLPQPPDTLSMTFSDAIATGPNAGLQYLLSPPADPSYKLYLHPAVKRPPNLSPGPLRDSVIAWQNRQVGGGVDSNNPNRPWCDGAGLDSIYSLSKRHEGWTHAPNSHWGIGDSLFAQVRFQDFFEDDVALAMARWDLQYKYELLFYYPSIYVDPENRLDGAQSSDYQAAKSICSFLP